MATSTYDRPSPAGALLAIRIRLGVSWDKTARFLQFRLAMSEREELRLRVEAEKKELEARLARLKVEGTAAANATAESIEKELKELQTYVRDGWDNLTEKVAGKLNEWLDKAKAA